MVSADGATKEDSLAGKPEEAFLCSRFTRDLVHASVTPSVCMEHRGKKKGEGEVVEGIDDGEEEDSGQTGETAGAERSVSTCPIVHVVSRWCSGQGRDHRGLLRGAGHVREHLSMTPRTGRHSAEWPLLAADQDPSRWPLSRLDSRSVRDIARFTVSPDGDGTLAINRQEEREGK